jgi:hypothetical protein
MNFLAKFIFENRKIVGKKGKWLFRIAEIWEIRGGFFRWSPKNTPTFSPYGGKSRRTKKIPVKSRDFFERRGLAP